MKKDRPKKNPRWYSKIYWSATKHALRRKLKANDFDSIPFPMRQEIINDYAVCDYRFAYNWDKQCNRKTRRFKRNGESVMKDAEAKFYFSK